MKSLFTGIDSSSHTAVSSAQVIYSFMSVFFLSVYLQQFIVIAYIYIFFSNRSLGNLLSWIPYSVSLIPFPDSRFNVLVLPLKPALPNYSIYFISIPLSPASHIFRGPSPPSYVRFCDTRISSFIIDPHFMYS